MGNVMNDEQRVPIGFGLENTSDSAPARVRVYSCYDQSDVTGPENFWANQRDAQTAADQGFEPVQTALEAIITC